MKKPKIENFAITQNDIDARNLVEFKHEEAKDKWSKKIGAIIAFGGPAYFAFESSSTFGGFIGVFIISLMFFGIFGIFSALIIVGLVSKIFYKAHPKDKLIQDYLDQSAIYDEWWKKMQKDFWLGLSGIGFEIELTKLFNKSGIKAETTKSSGDGGIDINIIRNGQRIIVQCKAHKAPVGVGAVRDLFGTLKHTQNDGAILASVSGFTKGVRDFVQGKPIELMDLDDYIKMQRAVTK